MGGNVSRQTDTGNREMDGWMDGSRTKKKFHLTIIVHGLVACPCTPPPPPKLKLVVIL